VLHFSLVLENLALNFSKSPNPKPSAHDRPRVPPPPFLNLSTVNLSLSLSLSLANGDGDTLGQRWTATTGSRRWVEGFRLGDFEKFSAKFFRNGEKWSASQFVFLEFWFFIYLFFLKCATWDEGRKKM